jgi:phage terminase large subunit GpA-like protein
VLPPDSPEPGPWRTDRTPFWWPVYEAASADQYDTIVIVCGSQMGKTEAMFNVLGHRFTDGPYQPALYVGPTEKNTRSMSKDRVHKMLSSTPVLWERTERGQRYSIYEKWIGGTPLRFGWAGSATELASHPCGIVLVDERDRMASDTGGEGDPVELARARTKNYPFRKIIISSTPTVEGQSAIWQLWEGGTRHMWAWECLGCKAWFIPHLAALKWPDGATPDEAVLSAWVECPHCLHQHTPADQPTLNAHGRYIRHRKLKEGEGGDKAIWGQYIPDTDARPTATASFWVSGLASPWASFGQTARLLISAYKAGDQERIKGVVNTWGGELFRQHGEAPEWQEVSALRQEYQPRTIPAGVQRITLGADVQRNGIYFVIRGWGHNSESWLLEEGMLSGETDHDAVWQSLRLTLLAPIGDRRIDRAFIDSGYRPGDVYRRPDHAVYTFARSLPGVAYPTKGQDSGDQPFKYSNIDYTFGGKVIKNGVRLYLVNTDYWKRWLHSRIRWPEDQPGGFHLHVATTEDYCKQLVAEELVLKASGRATWVRKSRQNHYLDCEVLAACAGYSINVHKLGIPPPETEAPGPTSRGREVAPRSPSLERRPLW